MIYEYRCDSCQKTTEVRKTMKEAERREYCPCGKPLRRIYSPLATVWGIGGWDYSEGGMGGRSGDKLELRHHQ